MSECTEEPLGPVSEILLAWEECRERGESIAVEDLCRDRPELAEEVARRIRILESVYRVPNQAAPTLDGDSIAGPPHAPPRVPGYEILETLGHGGMGVVYKVRHQRLHRLCALKMLRYDGPTGPMERARFRTEAEAIAALQHPNIVQLYEVGEVGRVPYLILEYVEGTTLAERIRSGPISTKDAAELVRTLADAVEYAHSRGIIHRDLKPGNILLSVPSCQLSVVSADTARKPRTADNGPLTTTPKITDFGLAKRLPGTTGVETNGPHTATGAVFGTPAYMAPEQALGHTRDIGPAADVYSLGAILYELLTGRPPFQAESVLELLSQVRSMEPVSPRRLRPQLPGDLDTICLKCLPKEPAKRYAGAGALADDLRRYLTGQPIRARRVAMSERAWRWCRRNPVVAGLTGAVAATLVIGTLVASALAVWALGERDRARLELGNALVAQAAALQGTGQIGQRFESLRLLHEAARELRNHPQGRERLPDIRNHVIAALSLTDLKVEWERPVRSAVGSQFDAKLERYTIVDYTKQVFVRRADNDQTLLTVPPPGIEFWYANTNFSPDGQYLLASYWLSDKKGTLLHVWHIDRNELVFSQRTSPGQDLWLLAAIHPNGRWLVFAAPDSALLIWDLVEGREIRRMTLNAPACSIAMDRSGERVAVGESDARRIRILELDSGKELSAWHSENGVGALAWSADGQLIACTGVWGRVGIWHVPRGELLAVLYGHTSEVIHLQFAHSGHLLATASWDRTTRLWDAVSGISLATAPGNFRRFSTDDRRIAFTDGTKIGAWEVAHDLECRTLHPGLQGALDSSKGYIYGASFSADSRLLATCEHAGVRLWDATTGIEWSHLQMGVCHPVLFHPNGHSMISHSVQGTYRWPIHVVSEQLVEMFRIGPPEELRVILPSKKGWSDAKWTPGHAGLAVNDRDNSQVRIYDLTQPNASAVESSQLKSAHDRVISISVSPDGQWLVAGAWKADGIQIWNIPERNRLEPVLRITETHSDLACLAYFSPDGRWLVSATNDELGSRHGYHFWRTGTWEFERFIPAKLCSTRAAFSDNGRVMALSVSARQILLADPTDGRELARLSTLQPIGPYPAAFSPDGAKLAALTGRRTVMVWDLRRVREHLAAMGLDWEAPAYIDSEETLGTKPLQVKVIGKVPKPGDL